MKSSLHQVPSTKLMVVVLLICSQQYVAELAAIGQHVIKTATTYALDAIVVVIAAGADEVRKTAPPCLDFNLGATVDECDVFSTIETDMCKHSESKAAKEFTIHSKARAIKT